MTVRPLVSAITGTWQRHALLLEAIENLREQTYRPLEHIVVSDGPDPVLRELVARESGYQDVPITFVELGRNWSTYLTDSMSAVPFGVAQWMARGDLIMWLADDERLLVPDAIESMVGLLEASDADFVYPKVEFYWRGRTEKRFVLGEPFPREGTFTHCLHRADILDVPHGGFQTHVGAANDHEQVRRWIAAGKTWAFLDRVTLSHRIDK